MVVLDGFGCLENVEYVRLSRIKNLLGVCSFADLRCWLDG